MTEHGYGGFWIRFLALLVDMVILATLVAGLFAAGILFRETLGATGLLVIGILYAVGPLLYSVGLQASNRQATFGKALLGLSVSTTQGERLSVLRSLGRELAKILSAIPLMLGYVAAAFTTRKQAVHDVVASTEVVRTGNARVGVALAIAVLGWLAPIGIAVGAGVGPLLSMMGKGVLQTAMGGAMPEQTAQPDSAAASLARQPAVPVSERASSQAPASETARRTVPVAGTSGTVGKPETKPAESAVAGAVASSREAAAPPRAVERSRPASPPPPAPVDVEAKVVVQSSRPETRSAGIRVRQPETARELAPEAVVALDQLSPRFAHEVPLVQGWFRDRAVLYYDFGSVPRGVSPARVFWPIHGFDARGNPVAIRGQRPIFTTIPRLGDYSGLWRLTYVVTADMAQSNAMRDAASVDAAVRARKAVLRDANVSLNLPIVANGTTLARDTTRGMLGWYEGRDVQFFDFGQVDVAPAPMLRFAVGKDGAGEPVLMAGQHAIVDSIPVAPSYPDVRDIRYVRVDAAFAVNSLKSAAAVRNAGLAVDSAASTIRNLPVAMVDGVAAVRAPSPLRAFADLRSPLPARPTPAP